MKKPPVRLWIGVMIFMTTFTNYMLRAYMSVSIIGMVDQKSKNFTIPCKGGAAPFNTTVVYKTTKNRDETYNWDETQIGNIISAYFYGCIATSIPGGILSEFFGPWHVILWSSIAATVLTGLTPLSAQLGPSGVIVNRLFVGLFGGVAFPAVNVLISKWAPPEEKGKFMATIMGNTLGAVVAFTLVGYVTDELGWKWGFYVLVILMTVYCVIFAVIVADSPDKHRWISEEERQYIKRAQEGHASGKKSYSLPGKLNENLTKELNPNKSKQREEFEVHVKGRQTPSGSSGKKQKVPPYLKILQSRPFWVCTMAQFGSFWGINLILSYGPKFMAETLGFNITASAGLAALPYMARLVCSQLFGLVSDYIGKKRVMSATKMRKFFIIFSHLIPGTCMLLIRAAGCNHVGVIALLVLNQAFTGAVVVSHVMNPHDLSPNFVGSVFGLMNAVAMTTGIFVPTITAALNTHYDKGLEASTIIYTIGGCVFAFSGLVFMLFGEAKVQPWNEITEQEKVELEDDESNSN